MQKRHLKMVREKQNFVGGLDMTQFAVERRRMKDGSVGLPDFWGIYLRGEGDLAHCSGATLTAIWLRLSLWGPPHCHGPALPASPHLRVVAAHLFKGAATRLRL